MRTLALATITAMLASSTAGAQALRPDQDKFRSLFKELVETNTTLSAGSCTLAAERMAARLKAAGYTDTDITMFSTPQYPKDGGLVANLPGSALKRSRYCCWRISMSSRRSAKTGPVIPSVSSRRMVFFYARGVSDDKAQAAIFTDTMIRLRAEPRPRHTLKLALTCGEETTGAFNGASWLSSNKRELIDAEFALNEGGGGRLDKDGNPLLLAIQVSEKIYQDYTLEVMNPRRPFIDAATR